MGGRKRPNSSEFRFPTSQETFPDRFAQDLIGKMLRVTPRLSPLVFGTGDWNLARLQFSGLGKMHLEETIGKFGRNVFRENSIRQRK